MTDKLQEFVPFERRVLVKKIEVEQKSEGGLFLPGAEKEKHDEGRVVTAGPDCVNVHVDDIVLFYPFAGINIVIEGRNYIVIEEAEIFGTLSPAK